MDEVNLNSENETKSDTFHWTYSNLTNFLNLLQNTEIFQWL